MKQTFDLNKMGLAPMSISEMQEVDGGDGMYMPMGTGGSSARQAGAVMANVGATVAGFIWGVLNSLL